MKILITNDDGIEAQGLLTLCSVLSRKWDTVVVAPDREQSATSHSLTLNRPLQVIQVGEKMYSVDGTPTDCVMYAVHKLLPNKPDLVVSGINHGANLADDVTYSGTVAAAIEGTLLGIPSLAISLPRMGGLPFEQPGIFASAGRFVVTLVDKVVQDGLPPDTLLNVNVPNCRQEQIAGIRITHLGRRIYRDVINSGQRTEGQWQFRISGIGPDWEGGEDSDVSVIHHNMISITPLHIDYTNHSAVEKLRRWKFE
jgi:5'-nucleotidase